LVHLIPAANHEQFAIKCSFRRPRTAPRLLIENRLVNGKMTDTEGRYFSFYVDNLHSDYQYKLQLIDNKNNLLCSSWNLSTFPSPDSMPNHARLLVFTCAGGYPKYNFPAEQQPFLPLGVRQRLIARGLSFKPNALIAIGDQLYWDQRTQLDALDAEQAARAQAWYESVGSLDRRSGAKGTKNEAIIKRAVEPQIASLYGVMLRSTPSYFVSDDHDYFENDEATDRFVTLPPHKYQLSFARFVRDLFLPEFLPDVARPSLMSGAGAGDRDRGISESFGTFRYGNLAEALIYDCARFLSLKGSVAGLIPPEAEHWLAQRTSDQTVRHLFHIPSHPFGWTAGKWREWYPDVADTGDDETAVAQVRSGGTSRFKLTTKRRKFMWQSGWFKQHQRLLKMLGGQESREGIVLSGDLHATGHALIRSSSDVMLDSAVHAILTGPIGTRRGWPSASRGTPPVLAAGINADTPAPVSERNGFTLIDLRQDEAKIQLFAWRNEPVEVIDTLKPYHSYTVERRS
ncbi:MAG: hypothetical protein VB933_06375, partial [Pseudomonadales bacterium]